MSFIDQAPDALEEQDPSTSKTSSRGKTWLVIGSLRLGTKRTDDELNKRAAFILAHPEMYSPHARAKRIKWEYYDHKFVMTTSDIVIGLGYSMRTAQRMLQTAREKLEKNKNDIVSVAEFCYFYKLNEREIRMRIVPKPAGEE
jgi:hypothetical protein